jgi:hypothetical protein
MSERAVQGQAVFLTLPGIGLIEYFSVGSAQFFGSFYFIFFLSVAVALGEGARKDWNLSRWAGSAIAAGVGCVVFAILLAKFFGAGSLVEGARGYVETVIVQIVELNKTSGVSNFQTQYLAQHGNDIASFLVFLLPSLIFVFVLLSVVLNILVGRRLVRVPRALSRLRQTVMFRLPDSLVWTVIGSGIAFFIDRYVLHLGWIKFLAINGLIAIGALYFFQGLAVVAFFIERMRMRLLRLLIYITIILFFQSIGLVLVGVGLADVWVHFRERAQKLTKEERGEK